MSLVPTLQAEGSVAAVTSGNLTVTLPAHDVNDVLFVSVLGYVPNTAGDAALMTGPSGWTELVQWAAPFPSEIEGRVGLYALRADSSSETDPVFTRPGGWDTGTDTCFAGRAYTIRQAVTTDTPAESTSTSASYTTANGNLPAVTVSGSNRTVFQFLISDDDQATGTAPATWTAGTAAATTTGTGAGFQTFRQEDVSASTSAVASNVSAPAQGIYIFLGASVLPDVATGGMYYLGV